MPSGSGEPAVQLSGCELPCHRWTNYTDNSIPGFGNLHTINSWWFSQLIIRKEIYLIPAYLECSIDGPDSFCEGDTEFLALTPVVVPEGAVAPQVTEIVWSGPGIVDGNGTTIIEVNQPGTYFADLTWDAGFGDTCFTSCEFTIGQEPNSAGMIDTLIIYGETVEINGEQYTEGGQYVQLLTASNGCDSVLLITITTLNTAVLYDLDACVSRFGDDSGSDYTEFTASNPQPLNCASIDASIIWRENPEENRHSCTPGVDGSVAMCVGALEDCSYDPGNEKSIIFELTVTPSMDTAVAITALSFFEKAPEEFDWINGADGPNNYPTLYGVRILKDGTEIYSESDIPTSQDWSEEVFDFLGNDDFLVDTTTTFRFELLGYCLVDNGAVVAAWDIDEVTVQASCTSPTPEGGLIAGEVKTGFGASLKDVEIYYGDDPLFNAYFGQTNTASDGSYGFEEVVHGRDYHITAYDNKDHRNGVSTLDLILIQKHILGLKPFESPLQWIAADANRSESLTARDLVELRKLILGLHEKLPRNTSWRFGNADALPSLDSPWGLQEMISIPGYSADHEHANFVGVKIGDINGDADLNLHGDGSVGFRSKDQLQLRFVDQWLESGEIAEVDIIAGSSAQLYGLQMALEGQGVEVVGITSEVMAIADGAWLRNGGVAISWSDARPVVITSGEALLTLQVRVTSNGNLSDKILLNSDAIRPEGYVGENLSIVGLSLQAQSMNNASPEALTLGAAPNPFTNRTTLLIDTDSDEEVTVELYSATGQLMTTDRVACTPGRNTYELFAPAAGGSAGVFIVRVKSNKQTAELKLLRLSR